MKGYFGQSHQFRRSPSIRAVVATTVCFSISLISGIAALYLSFPSEETVSVINEPPLETDEVLIPIRDIAPGNELSADSFRSVSFPSQNLHPKLLRSFEEAKGQYAKFFIAEGVPLHRDYLTREKVQSPISPTIPAGYRAVSIKVNDITSVDGLVRPGEVVDVAWIRRLHGVLSLSVIVQNAKVLAADRSTDGQWKANLPIPGTITLLVPTIDSQRIQLALHTGALSLSLRGLDGRGEPDGIGTLNENTLDPAARVTEVRRDCRGSLRLRGPQGIEELCILGDGSIAFRTEEDRTKEDAENMTR